MSRNDDTRFPVSRSDRYETRFSQNHNSRYFDNRYQQNLRSQINICDPNMVADTEIKKRMLDTLQVNRKYFEQEKLYNLLQVLEDKYFDLGNQQIMLFTNDASIKQHNIKEYVPKDMYQIARYMGDTVNTDIFSCIMAILASTAIAMRSRYRLSLDRYWTEMINLYILLAKNSGENKSTLCEMVKQPHRNFLSRRRKSKVLKNERLREMQPTIRDAARDHKRALISWHTREIRKFGESSKSTKTLIDGLISIKDDFSQYIIPQTAREEIFFDVTTSLGLVKKLLSQGETLAMIEPEAAMLLSKFFKDKSLIPILLKSYGAESYQYDSSTPGRCIFLERPSINILLMLQNSVMFELFDNELLMNIGFLPRTLPIIGGHFDNHIQSDYPIIVKNWMSVYDDKISSILEFTYTQDIDREIFDIPCDPDARLLALDFREENLRCLEAGQYLHMAPFMRKLHGTAVRIAGCIHGWTFPRPHEHPITVKEMKAGIALAKICRDHANIAFDTKTRETVRFAIKILKYLLKQDWTRSQPLPLISASDLQRNIAGLNKAKCLPALDFLEQHNFIRQHHEPRYAPLVILHPNLFQVNLDHLTDI